MATDPPPSTPSRGETAAAGERLRATLENLDHTLDEVRRSGLLKRLMSDVADLPTMSLQERIKERWARIRAELGGASAINGIEALYRSELHDLHDAELQAGTLADEIWVTIRNEPLAQRVSEYAAEMRSRNAKLSDLLSRIDGSTRERPNEAMHALVHETSEMAELCGEAVRDIALAAAFQRIVHAMSADYETLAAHAATLGRTEEATQFAEDAGRNREVEDALRTLTQSMLNPQAAGTAAA